MGVVAPILLAVLGSVAAAAMLPNDHAFLKKFGGHLRCPYASKWLQHGPERAAELLNVRRLDDALVGSCTYTNPFAGVEACFEMRGSDWTAASAEARCATAMGASMPSVSGELTYGSGCVLPDAMAGWCMVAEGTEASPTALGDDGCDGAATACATWMSGDFVADGACASEETTDVVGSCTYTNPFAGVEACFEMRGDWTAATAEARCATAMGASMPSVSGELAYGAGCALPDPMAGWCMTAEHTEASPTALGDDGCDGAATACATWMSGDFVADGACASEETTITAGPRCVIAPGPMGAAHQLGSSAGYDADCEGTPAEGSPYMWPPRWAAETRTRSMAFGSDAVEYESSSTVWYFLDGNMKRNDIHEQRGVLRAIGQVPCDEEHRGEGTACDKSASDHATTVLHRGTKMYFIEWADGVDSTIAECSWLDLSVVGNVRPDWFMDDRGDATDVQYLGDQHILHEGAPRLVKQWRKMDFADQYFTMSVQANAGDGPHWPLVLNIPGEGFGDDQLNEYTGHRLLTDADEDAFYLDVAFEAAGGSCPQRASSGTDGPPTGDVEHVPSNLERDDDAWLTLVKTFSPVWTPPEDDDDAATTGLAWAEEVGDGVFAAACEDAGGLRLEVTWRGADAAPYAALGFLDDGECLMTPRGGGDRDVVFLHADDGAYAAHAGSLSPDLKSFSADATGAFYASLVEVDAAFEADVAFEDGGLSLRLLAPGPHFTFALGNAPQLGYHATRGCFTVEGAPSCAAVAAAADAAAPCEAAVAIDDDDDRVLELESTVAELRGELAAFRSDWAAAAEDAPAAAPAVPPAVDQELRDEVSALRQDVDGFERDWREAEEEPAAHDEVLRGEVAALRSDVDGLRGDRRDAPAPALAAPAR